MNTIDVSQVLETVREPVLVLDDSLRVVAANGRFCGAFEVGAEETIGRGIFQICGGGWDAPALHALLEGFLASSEEFQGFVFEQDFPRIGTRSLIINARRVEGGGGKAPAIMLAIEDVTARTAAQEATERAQAQLSATLSSLDDGIITTDAAARVTYMNAAAERMTGWSRAEVSGRAVGEFLNLGHERSGVVVEVPLITALASGESAASAAGTVLIARRGARRPVEARATAFGVSGGAGWAGGKEGDSGPPLGAVLVLRDVSQRVSAGEAQARLAAIVDSTDDAIVSKTLDGVITTWNRGAERIFGYTAAEAIGRPIMMLFPNDRRHEEAELLERIARGEHVEHYETARVTKAGREILVSLTLSPVRDATGRVVGASKIVRDVTAQRAAEQEAVRQRELVLASEQAARAQADEANRAKDAFLATLSHELRAPINAILGWSVLLRASGACPAGEMAEGLAVIERNARAQESMVAGVLDVARIVSNKFQVNLRACDLAEIVRAAAEEARPAAAAKGLELVVEAAAEAEAAGSRGLMVSGDETRLRQVFWNLWSNALKFTPEGGRVKVKLERVEGRGVEAARLTMIDTGAGISRSFLPQVFERFRQEDEGTSRTFGGLGLGLSIARHIVAAHGGTIVAESPGPGLGTTVIVELPLLGRPSLSAAQGNFARPMTVAAAASALTAAPAAPAADAGLLRGLDVLVVDDEADARTLVQRLLQWSGAAVTVASSAREACRLISERSADRPFDLLVCDIGMPGEDGYSFMRRVRAAKAGCHGAAEVPAIALTGFTGPAAEAESLRSGFQLHVPKPVDPEELVKLVESTVRQAG